MSTRAVALAVLVVGASLAALAPAGATGGPESSELAQAHEADRTPPELPEQWQETYGGDGDDVFADVVRTPDGGYLLAGWSERNGSDDGWLVKVDGSGDRQWSETLGGSGTDRFYGVVPTGEGYLVAGRTDVNGTQNGWIVEVDSDGEVTDERTPGAGAFYAVARDDGVAHADALADASDSENASDSSADAGYLLAGTTYGDAGTVGWMLKLDADRGEAWRTSVATPEGEGYDDGRVRAVVPTDSGYYLAGKLAGDSDDGWGLKVDASGETEWQTAVGGPSRDDVWAAAPAGSNPAEAGFVLAGETESDSDGPRDGWLVKFGSDGAVEWNRSPGGDGTQWLDSAMRTDDGFLFTGGSDQGPHGSADGYVLATDDAGESRWVSYHGTGAWDKPWPTIRAHGDGYLLAGKTTSGGGDGGDGWLVRIGGNATGGNGTDAASDASSTIETTSAGGTNGTDEANGTDESTDGTTGSSDTSDASDAALADETKTATETPSPVPGFGAVAALVALLAGALLALRR